MMETGLRLFQIANHLKLPKLADYAKKVFTDYIDLIWCHFDEFEVTSAQRKCYAGEIELVGRGLLARGKNETTETLLTLLASRCVTLSEGTTWLDKTISGLRRDVPDFKATYDRHASARR